MHFEAVVSFEELEAPRSWKVEAASEPEARRIGRLLAKKHYPECRIRGVSVVKRKAGNGVWYRLAKRG